MRLYLLLSALLSLFAGTLSAQDQNIEYHSWVRLEHTIQVSKLNAGDRITARMSDHVYSDGKMLIPYNKAKLVGHVVEVQRAEDKKGPWKVVIAFDAIATKGREIPVAGVVVAMEPPVHILAQRSGSGSVPTSGDNPIARAAGPMTDSSGRAVIPSHAPISQPGPRTAVQNQYPTGSDDIQLHPDPGPQLTTITGTGKDGQIESDTRMKVQVKAVEQKP